MSPTRGRLVHSSVGLAAHPRCHAPRERSLHRAPGRPTAGVSSPFCSGALIGMTGVNLDSKGPKLARAGVQSQQFAASSASPGRGGECGHQSEPPANRLSVARRPPRSRPARETSLSGGRGAGRPAVVCVAPLPTPPARTPGPPGLANASPSAPAPTPVAPRREATLLVRPAAPGDDARARPSRTRHAASPAPRAGLDAREFNLKSPEASARKASPLLQPPLPMPSPPPPLPPRPLLRSFRPCFSVYLAPARSAPSRLMTGRTIEARGEPGRRDLESETIEMDA